MSLISAARGAQPLMMSEFIFNYNDTGVDVLTGAVKGFGTAIAENLVMDCNLLPLGAVVDHGLLLVETAWVGPTVATAAFATSASATTVLAATTLETAGETVITGKDLAQINAGENIRLTMATTVAVATAGRARLRIFYTIDRRATEVNTQ